MIAPTAPSAVVSVSRREIFFRRHRVCRVGRRAPRAIMVMVMVMRVAAREPVAKEDGPDKKQKD
jgi:hypothetical protein